MSLSDYYQQCPLKKPEPRRKTEARKDRKQHDRDSDVRIYVFARERDICRCCRKRAAESRHEIKPKGAGGKVSRKNCIAVCGQLVGVEPSCHTYLQQHQIEVGYSVLGAEAELIFTPNTVIAAEYMQIALGEQIVSLPMVQVEQDI